MPALSLEDMSTPPHRWRLIRSGHLSGAMNMAIDDALLHSVACGASPPVLRLYRWRPATLTLGYAQLPGTAVDLNACATAGIDVVRRPTGGRAVLHDREVTYAVIAPCSEPFGTSVAHCYRTIAGVLQNALRSLGLAAELVPGQQRGQQGRAVCFTAPAQHELLIGGCKVAGCAQKRRGAAFLQHGSLPLDIDLGLLQRLMPVAPGEEAGERQAAIGWLNRFASRPLTVDEVEEALVAAFRHDLGIEFAVSELNDLEKHAAADLHDQYYADPQWTRRGPGQPIEQGGGSC